MRYLILLIACYFPFSGTYAQMGALSGNVGMSSMKLVEVLDRDWKTEVVTAGGSLEPAANTRGSLFFNEDWNNGFVLLKGSQIAKNVSIRFNSYTNQIYFKKDDKVLVLDASVPVIGFGLEGGSDDPGRTTVFLCGYPASGPRNANTFYEVVAFGRLSLLKFHSKKILEEKDQNRVPIKAVIDADYWFVFDSSANTMTEIRHNKNSLLESSPVYAPSIRQVLDEKKLKLKADEDWPVLFDELNRRKQL